jgi:hypothetical protein
MTSLDVSPDPSSVVRRLQDACNAHDVDAIVARFSADYWNETPAHPGRSFVGRDQVRLNWTRILAAVPDLTTQIVASAVDGETVWTEWEHRGTRPDGSAHLMRGVVVFGVPGTHGGLISWARFFLEPVEHGSGGIDDAVRRQVGGAAG